MKKIISVMMAFFMISALGACANRTDSNSSETGAALPERSESSTVVSKTGSERKPGETPKVLVAYFSCTGTTENLAGYAADALHAKLFAIVPVHPYTSADLNYQNDNSRTTKEMNDPASRPAIAGAVADMAVYDIVLLGYPIWWGDAPRIISTFLESYDFSGKTIVPFCTSGGSGIDISESNIKKLTKGATWLSGKRFGSASRDDIVTWINSMNLGLTAE